MWEAWKLIESLALFDDKNLPMTVNFMMYCHGQPGILRKSSVQRICERLAIVGRLLPELILELNFKGKIRTVPWKLRFINDSVEHGLITLLVHSILLKLLEKMLNKDHSNKLALINKYTNKFEQRILTLAAALGFNDLHFQNKKFDGKSSQTIVLIKFLESPRIENAIILAEIVKSEKFKEATKKHQSIKKRSKRRYKLVKTKGVMNKSVEDDQDKPKQKIDGNLVKNINKAISTTNKSEKISLPGQSPKKAALKNVRNLEKFMANANQLSKNQRLLGVDKNKNTGKKDCQEMVNCSRTADKNIIGSNDPTASTKESKSTISEIEELPSSNDTMLNIKEGAGYNTKRISTYPIETDFDLKANNFSHRNELLNNVFQKLMISVRDLNEEGEEDNGKDSEDKLKFIV